MQKKIVVALILSIAIAIFAISNAVTVPVNFVFYSVHISAALVILISACIGAMIVYFIGAVSRFKLKKRCKELEASKRYLEQELSQWKEKNQPLEATKQNEEVSELSGQSESN